VKCPSGKGITLSRPDFVEEERRIKIQLAIKKS